MPHSPARLSILATVSTFALCATALAQQTGTAETTAVDNPVFVLGTVYLDAEDVAGYVASGAQVSKSLTPISEQQQAISVVTRDQIDDQGAQNLGQALSYSSGINAEPFGADPRFDAPTMRGFESSGAQYVNGLRQSRYFGGVSYETYGMQQIEVMRGPSSALYGPGSPIGIINQVQKRAQSADFSEVGVGYDSNQSGQVFFDINRAASDTLSWRFTGIGRDEQTQIDELTNERAYLAGALRWNPDAMTTIDVMASYTKDSPISPTGVPYALTEIADGDDLREMYTGQENWDDSDRKMWNIGVEVSRDLDNGWTLSQGFRYEKFDWDYTGTYVSTGAVVNPDGTFLRGSSWQSESTESLSLDTRLNGEVTTGQAVHQLLVGVDVRKYDADETSQIQRDTTIFNWRDPGAYVAPPEMTIARSSGETTLKQVGVYAQDEIIYGNWHGTAGLRYDWAKQTGDQYDVPSEYEEDEVTGRAGLSYVFANGLMPYLSYATSFDPQTGLNENEDPLKPTKGYQWEAGVKYQPTSFDGLITASVYDLRQTNVNQYAGRNDAGNLLYYQVGEVKSRGLELEATAELNAAWKIRASYAYNDTEQQGGTNTGQPMWNAPRHSANLWVDYDFANGLELGGGLRYIGERDNVNNTIELDSYTLVDAAARYTRGNVEASLNLSNLTDETYLATCSWFGCYYGEGRTASAKVTYKW
ncbi:TonB-dependent siderophore receptor [Paracoccus aerodenitrificans]|uniref:TonB-dependent siderophore receptor n=1 Tax=Paracoccus aerodenitrificans TaxID=3017781 RepID=UPI0022F0566B|nr:TonB-dependent siderophore receptor [Paracoccus aerodenitrificans]WBU65307.1 TonB-dependent siderophore receptor [Paracoccus aerodenitrificans]